MDLHAKYFELCYSKRIHEFKKIADYKGIPEEEARSCYKTLDEFYRQELGGISAEALQELRTEFKPFNDLYTRYFNPLRASLFQDRSLFLNWYKEQNDACHYCLIPQADLQKIVAARGGNLTLNKKTKRSKGTLEIDQKNPGLGYTFDNVVLSCPFCNNAKSNLVSYEHWKEFFAEPMRQYLDSLLKDDCRQRN